MNANGWQRGRHLPKLRQALDTARAPALPAVARCRKMLSKALKQLRVGRERHQKLPTPGAPLAFDYPSEVTNLSQVGLHYCPFYELSTVYCFRGG